MESPRGVVANVLGYNIVVSEFKIQSHYDVYFQTNTFRKGIKALNPSAMGWIVPLVVFYKDGFGIK